MNISAIIPSFNEEENLKIVLPMLHEIIGSLCDRYELLVVDSKETSDGTKEVCEKNNAKHIVQENKGYGDAFRTGLKHSAYEAIVIVDADLSQDILKIPQMYKALTDGCDVVIGSRYVRGGTTEDSCLSVMMSKLLNGVYRLVLGFRQKDVSTDFRFYRKDKILSIETYGENFDVIEETLFLLKEKYPSLKIKEIPINYKPREKGVSKRRLLCFMADYIKLMIKLLRKRF